MQFYTHINAKKKIGFNSFIHHFLYLLDLCTLNHHFSTDIGGGGERNEKTVPKLARLVELLRSSNLSDDDLEELMRQLQDNRHPGKPAVPISSEHDFAHGGQTLSFTKYVH
uniref:Uncharacterized protein n=1 Tax=Parascaris equorum TaxID=6256 RepID=A0A914R4Z2_PAREQ